MEFPSSSTKDSLNHKIVGIINQLALSGKPFNVEIIKKKLSGEDENKMSLFKVYNDYLSMILGHASVQVTLDAYGAFNDQLLLENVNMLRKKLS